MKILSKNLFLAIACLLCITFSAEAKKEKIPCQIHVTTEPEGATVYCDGVSKGASPLTITDLTQGEHLVIAKKKNYRTSRQTIILRESQRQAVDIKLYPVTAIVIVHSKPAGADVKVNGNDKGKTPLLITDMPLGKHRIEIAHPGHVSKKLELNCKDRTPKQISLDLTTDSAKVILDSTPSGATVILNGIEQGTTPCTLDSVPRGESTIELHLDGHTTHKRTVKLNAGQEERMEVVLKQIPSELKIVTIPEGARIYINNQFKGVSPVTLKESDPGSYRIRTELPAHESMLRTIELEPDTSIVEEFRMERNSGLLKLTTQPAGALIILNGKKIGLTVAKKEKTDRVSETLVINEISEGSHKMTVTKSGYFDRKFNITIKKKETSSKHVLLKRRFIPNYEVRTRDTTFSGVLVKIDQAGGVMLEIKPGIFKTISKKDILIQRPLRKDRK